MGFSSRSLYQDITYWAPSSNGATNRFGHPVPQTPVLIRGRWENKIQQVTKLTGEEVTSSAVVYCDREVDIGGHLALGDLRDAGVELPQEVQEIQTTMTVPDLRNLENEQRAYL